ncbi:MAG TPA: aminopeptidase P N-terminal domain-containing protein [Candidatus Babeliales bacterium]|nr:aminopeptidase P N-terminal domain-containing protein [Candidatus Babeliales bacterium]
MKKLFFVLFNIPCLLFSELHPPKITLSEYAARRIELCRRVQEEKGVKSGVILSIAGLDDDSNARYEFVQDCDHHYLTGSDLSGTVLLMELSGKSTLFIPNNSERRGFAEGELDTTKESANSVVVDEIKYLGSDPRTQVTSPCVAESQYGHFIEELKKRIGQHEKIVTGYPESGCPGYGLQRSLLQHLSVNFVPVLADSIVDCSDIVADMRSHKSPQELRCLQHAVNISSEAHRALAAALMLKRKEAELEEAFIRKCREHGTRTGYPSIVAGGKNGTILHYCSNDECVTPGGLFVVDAAAYWDHYTADITRTYPVSGAFSEEQKNAYQLVLDCQTYIASIAKPGMWLNNKENPEESLNHLAHKYMEERGMDKFFIHSIGHYLGLNVHDAGDYTKPLEPGVVFTIEPGLYFADKGFGIRIEDNYVIIENGVKCLSTDLLSRVEEVEKMVQA